MMNFYGWVSKHLRGRKGQQGFTLIELLVVVTILGILAGIVTLSLVGLTTHANIQACQSEYRTVQAALDAYLADQNKVNGTGSVAEEKTFTNDMSTPVPLYNAAPSDTSPNYTRNGKTQFYYTWDAYGRITAIADSSGKAVGDPLNGGCVPK
jgi:prepilin-type N-terminal cleavage/methylation domain-containing protein